MLHMCLRMICHDILLRCVLAAALLSPLLTVLERLDALAAALGSPEPVSLTVSATSLAGVAPGEAVPPADSAKPYRGFLTVSGCRVDALCRLTLPPADGPVSGWGSLYLPSAGAAVEFIVAGSKDESSLTLTIRPVAVDAESKTTEDAPARPAFEQLRLSGIIAASGPITGSCSDGLDTSSASDFAFWYGGEASGSLLCRPWLADVTSAAAALFGRMSGILLQGPHVSFEEEELLPWLQSTVLQSGLGSEQLTCNSWCGDSPFSFPGVGESPATSAAVQDADAFITSLLESGVSDDTLPGPLLLAWLQSKTPENRIAAKAGRFPEIELILLSALAKHSGTGVCLCRCVRARAFVFVCVRACVQI